MKNLESSVVLYPKVVAIFDVFNWSSTRLNFANYCKRRYFLKYILREEQLLPSVYRRGSLMHNLMCHEKTGVTFWDRLGKKEEIKRNKKGKVISKKKYSNPEEFVDYAQGQWLMMCNQDEKAGRSIEWRFDGEMWEIYNHYIPQVCNPLFDYAVNEGPPIYSELKFDFLFEKRRFKGKIDEIRLNRESIVIRDYKTESPWAGEMKLLGNPQLTLYCFAVCSLAYKDGEFAKSIGLENERERFFGNPNYISDRIKPELFMFDTLRRDPETTKSMPELIYRTTRKDDDILALFLNLQDIEEEVKEFLSRRKKLIPSTEFGKKCDDCDMRKSCLSVLERELEFLKSDKDSLKDKTGQRYFSFVSPYSIGKQKCRRYKQKRFVFKIG